MSDANTIPLVPKMQFADSRRLVADECDRQAADRPCSWRPGAFIGAMRVAKSMAELIDIMEEYAPQGGGRYAATRLILAAIAESDMAPASANPFTLEGRIKNLTARASYNAAPSSGCKSDT
jgi:hypothetical protein